MRSTLRVLVRMLFLLPPLASIAAAQSDPAPDLEPGRNGPYLSVAGLYAFDNFDNDPNAGLLPPNNVDGAVGFTARGGWRFMRWAAAELSYEYVPFKGGFVAMAGMTHLKGILPLGKIEPYAMVGLGGLVYTETDQNNISGFAWRAGLGAQVHVVRHLSAFLEANYLGTTGDVENLPYGQFVWGLQVRF